MSEASEATGTETTTTEPTNGNGSAPKPDKGPSILEVLHKKWEAAGKKDPSAKQTGEMIADYKRKLKAQQAAEKALTEATKATDDAASLIVEKHGRHIEIPLEDGLNVPAAYGSKVYFKRVASTTRKTLGAS
jgi:hypothetical protein